MSMLLRNKILFPATLGLLFFTACSSSPNSSTTGPGGTGGTGGSGGGSGGGATGGSGGSGGGACSMEPASGFSVVVPPSDGVVGAFMSATQDENGDPLIAYVWEDPMGGSSEKSVLQFVRWDRCKGAFTAPVTIDTVGDQGFSAPERGASLAYDPASKKLVVAYQHTDQVSGNPTRRIHFSSSSDMGATWSAPASVSQDSGGSDTHDATEPSVAIHGSDVWIAYNHDNFMCCDQCGSCSGEWVGHSKDAGATWTYEIVKVGAAISQATGQIPSELRLDSNGAPGLVFVADDQDPAKTYNRQIVYYKVGDAGGATIVFDSNNVQNDTPSASLAFDGTKPRVVAHLTNVPGETFDMMFSSSTDGKTWSKALPLPRDGNDTTAWFQSLAIDSKGAAAVAAYVSGGPGDSKCGGPRILRSADLMTWSACGADMEKKVAVNGKWTQAYYPKSDKLSLVTTGTLMVMGDQTGILFWREP